ncbi:MAG: hypothetical protein ABJF07_25720, partial [Nisaea sp.]|uniref:hypothetical protein n=2 Tax=Alphaproteobacteria TaxID=28211 RepID=UPI003265FD13
ISSSATLDQGGSFPIQILYDALGRVISGLGPQQITAKDGSVWTAVSGTSEGEEGIMLSSGKRQHRIAEPWFIHPSAEIRLTGFERLKIEANVAGPEIETWKAKLSQSPLDYGFIPQLQKELALFPVNNAEALQLGVSRGELSNSALVPEEARYYHRLASNPGESTNALEYLQGVCSEHIGSLLNWNRIEGLRLSLLLSSHSQVARCIDLEAFEATEVNQVYEWLSAHGDRLSQVGGFELGVRHVDRFPGIEPHLADIATQISQDDPDKTSGRLYVSAHLFIFVEGSLARRGTLRSFPPFWRRQASFAQASLIERQLVAQKVQTEDIGEWLDAGRGQYFYLQTMADMRREPRWIPDFIEPHQLRHEFVGRIVAAACENAEKLPLAIRALTLDGERPLAAHLTFPQSYNPGPMEGGASVPREPPDEISAEIRKNLEGAAGDVTTFAALVNCSLVFTIGPELAGLAAKTIRDLRYLLNTGRTESVFPVLSGLAMVAAATRSPELAREVRVLVRAAFRRSPDAIDAINAMRIGLLAAAAHEGRDDWQEFVGEWITEIAFSALPDDDARQVLSHIRTLVQIEPGLGSTLSKAQAALQALLYR